MGVCVIMEVVLCVLIRWVRGVCAVVFLWGVGIGVTDCSYWILGVGIVMSVWVGVVVLGA